MGFLSFIFTAVPLHVDLAVRINENPIRGRRHVVFPNGLSGFTSASPSPFADFLLFSFVKEKERQGEAAERIQAAIRRKQTTSGQPRFPVFLYFPSDVYIFPTAVSRHGKIRPKESRKTKENSGWPMAVVYFLQISCAFGWPLLFPISFNFTIVSLWLGVKLKEREAMGNRRPA